MGKTPLIVGAAAIAVAAVVGGGYAYALHVGQEQVAEAAARIRQSLGPSGSFAYENPTIHPFSRSAELSRVALREADGSLLTADRVVAAAGTPGHLRSIHADGIRFAQSDGTLQAASMDAHDVLLPTTTPGTGQKLDAAAVTFADGTIRNVSLSSAAGSMSLASLRVVDYGAGRSSSAAALGFSMSIPDSPSVDRVGADSASASGLDLASLVDALEHGRAQPSLPGQASLAIDKVYFAKAGHRFLGMSKISLTGSTDITRPSSSKGEIVDAYMTTPDMEANQTLKQFGLDKVNYDMAVEAFYDPAGGKMRIAPVTVRVKNFGSVEFGVDLSHFDFTALQEAKGNPTAAGLALLAVSFVDAHLKVTDEGGLHTFFQNLSKQTNVPEDKLREASVRSMRDNDEFTTKVPDDGLRSVIEEFVSRGGSMDVKAQPPSPLTGLAMMSAVQGDPSTLFMTLNLSSRWNAPPATNGL